jgi:hypothetical protein
MTRKTTPHVTYKATCYQNFNLNQLHSGLGTDLYVFDITTMDILDDSYLADNDKTSCWYRAGEDRAEAIVLPDSLTFGNDQRHNEVALRISAFAAAPSKSYQLVLQHCGVVCTHDALLEAMSHWCETTSYESYSYSISDWDLSRITSLRDLLKGQRSCSPDVTQWQISSVTDTTSAFEDAALFDEDISRWDVQSVTSMVGMFNGALRFNQNIGNWNVAKVHKMNSMFFGAASFYQPTLSNWDTSLVLKDIFNVNNAFVDSGMSGEEPCWLPESPHSPCRPFVVHVSKQAAINGKRQREDDDIAYLKPDVSVGGVSSFNRDSIVVQEKPFYVAPPVIDTNPNVTNIVHGSIADLTYELRHIDSASQFERGLEPIIQEDWFINPITGVITGVFRNAGRFEFDIWVVDVVGDTAHLETYSWDVKPQRQFKPAFFATRRRAENDDSFTDYDGRSTRFHTGSHNFYKIAPLKLNPTATAVSAGAVGDITYRIKTELSGWFVGTETGDIIGNFNTVGKHSITLVAVDLGGEQFDVENYTFEVTPPPEFMLVLQNSSKFPPSPSSSISESASPGMPDGARRVVAVGDIYSLASPQINGARSTVSEGTLDDVTFSLHGPGGLCVRRDGEVQGVFVEDDIGVHALKVTAFDKGGRAVEVTNISLDVRRKDEATSAFGPHGRGCEHEGKAVDEIPFDEDFTCKCSPSFSGDNCEFRESQTVGGVLGGLFVVSLLGGLYVWHRSRAAAFQATDFKKALAQMKEAGEIDL